PGLDRGFDQQRVEHRPTRAVALAHAARCWRQAPQREWADVEPDARDRRAARGPDLLEQAPTLESGDARLVDVVIGDDIAREGGSVQQQDAVAAAGQEHRGW